MRGLAVIFLCLANAANAQSLLDRIQGLYYPDMPGTRWDCQSVAADGGALAVRGDQLIGVETFCTLHNPFPIPGMDAIRFERSCNAEGSSYDPGPIILSPGEDGLLLLSEELVSRWLRCP